MKQVCARGLHYRGRWKRISLASANCGCNDLACLANAQLTSDLWEESIVAFSIPLPALLAAPKRDETLPHTQGRVGFVSALAREGNRQRRKHTVPLTPQQQQKERKLCRERVLGGACVAPRQRDLARNRAPSNRTPGTNTLNNTQLCFEKIPVMTQVPQEPRPQPHSKPASLRGVRS